VSGRSVHDCRDRVGTIHHAPHFRKARGARSPIAHGYAWEDRMKNAQIIEFKKRALDKARQAGIPAYFLDETGQGVIRVLPDGRKDRILMLQGQPQVQPVECRC
jgi:hypothetical protein